MTTSVASLGLSKLAAKIDKAHQASYGNAWKAMEYAAECGQLLLQAKELVGHGEWIAWLEGNTKVSVRQSQKYMRLSVHWGEIENKCEPASSYLGINEALKSIGKPKPVEPVEEPEPVEPVEIIEAEQAEEEEQAAPRDGYRAFFRDNFKMRWWDLRPTRAEAVKDLEDLFADKWIEYADGTRRSRPMAHGFYCVATEERFQAIKNPEGSWCSVGPTEDEIFRVYSGPETPTKPVEATEPLPDGIEAARAHYAIMFADLPDEEQADEARKFELLLAALLEDKKKRASTLPADSSNDVVMDDPIPRADPAQTDLEDAIATAPNGPSPKKRGRPPGSKNKCKTCGGTGRVRSGKTGLEVDCDCVRRNAA